MDSIGAHHLFPKTLRSSQPYRHKSLKKIATVAKPVPDYPDIKSINKSYSGKVKDSLIIYPVNIG